VAVSPVLARMNPGSEVAVQALDKAVRHFGGRPGDARGRIGRVAEDDDLRVRTRWRDGLWPANP